MFVFLSCRSIDKQLVHLEHDNQNKRAQIERARLPPYNPLLSTMWVQEFPNEPPDKGEISGGVLRATDAFHSSDYHQ